MLQLSWPLCYRQRSPLSCATLTHLPPSPFFHPFALTSITSLADIFFCIFSQTLPSLFCQTSHLLSFCLLRITFHSLLLFHPAILFREPCRFLEKDLPRDVLCVILFSFHLFRFSLGVIVYIPDIFSDLLSSSDNKVVPFSYFVLYKILGRDGDKLFTYFILSSFSCIFKYFILYSAASSGFLSSSGIMAFTILVSCFMLHKSLKCDRDK